MFAQRQVPVQGAQYALEQVDAQEAGAGKTAPCILWTKVNHRAVPLTRTKKDE